MAANKWLIYNKFKEYCGDGTIDMDGDDFICSLHLVGSNCTTLTWDEYGDLDNEHATQYGYSQPGYSITGPTWVEAAGTVTFDSNNPTWTAASGSIICRFGVVYDTTPTPIPTDPLICYSLFDNTPLDVTVTDGNVLTIEMSGSGILTVSGGDS